MRGLGHRGEHGEAALVGAEVVLRTQAVEVVVEEVFRALDELREGRTAVRLDEAVRVVRRGHGGDADGEAAGEQDVERAHGGVLSGVVGVEA